MNEIINSTNFVIKRSRWLRGELNSCLLRENDNRMCCLGFYSLACGYKEQDIINHEQPDYLSDRSKYPEFIQKNPNDIVGHLMSTNDSRILSNIEREKELAELFATQAITVTFED